MDGPTLLGFYIGLVINGLTQQIKDPAQASLAYRHGNGGAGIGDLCAALQAVGGGHGNAADNVVTNVLGNLRNDGLVSIGNFDGVQQTGQLILLEANIQNRAHDLDHSSFVFGHGIQLLMLGWVRDQEPATISVISWVMEACRARLNFRLRSAIISSAFCVAESIALRRAACSEARLSQRVP